MEHEWLNEIYVIRFHLVCLFVKILLEILSFRVRMTSCMETVQRKEEILFGEGLHFMKNYLLCFRLRRMLFLLNEEWSRKKKKNVTGIV